MQQYWGQIFLESWDETWQIQDKPKLGKLAWTNNSWATEIDLGGDWAHDLRPDKVNPFSVTWIQEISLFFCITLGLLLTLLISCLLFSLTFCCCQWGYKDVCFNMKTVRPLRYVWLWNMIYIITYKGVEYIWSLTSSFHGCNCFRKNPIILEKEEWLKWVPKLKAVTETWFNRNEVFFSFY